MEYAKNIILDLGNRQALEKEQSIKKRKRIVKKIMEHKIMSTIIFLTLGFIICDIMLISSFVNILGKI